MSTPRTARPTPESTVSALPASDPHPAAARRRAGRIGALSSAAALGLTLTTMAAPAWAHDSLITSTPEADEVLEESPEEVTLEFSGGGLTTGDSIVNLIAVTGEDGENWEGETEVEGSTMWTELPAELPEGDYTVAYRVVYSDGHAEEQSFDFEMAASEAAPTAAESEPETPAESDAATESDATPGENDDAAADASAEDPDHADETVAGDAAADTQQPGPAAWIFGAAAVVLVALLAVGAVALRRRRGSQRP